MTCDKAASDREMASRMIDNARGRNLTSLKLVAHLAGVELSTR